MTRSMRARWIVDGSGRSFADHALVSREGEVQAITPERSEGDRDLGEALIVPGLVNAHVHLDLSFCLRPEFSSFASWVRKVIAHRLSLSVDEAREAIAQGVKECLAAGVTTVGDISATGQSWEALEKAGLRGTVYFECLGLSAARVEGNLSRFEDWLAAHEPTHCLQPGISPHAPYSTASRIYRYAGGCGLPVATHIAESREEVEFLVTGEGPFKDLLVDLGIDPELVDVENAKEIGDLLRGSRLLGLVHGNHCPELWPREWSTGQGWIHCPRTHHYFGHPVHPFASAAFDPSKWCLATDGRSSNPDLDLLAEAQFVHTLFPQIAPAQLLSMITQQPAQLLGWGHKAGTLQPGKGADFLVFRPAGAQIVADEPHAALMAGHWRLEEVWIAGEQRIPGAN